MNAESRLGLTVLTPDQRDPGQRRLAEAHGGKQVTQKKTAITAPRPDDPCHHCGKQLTYSHTLTPQFPGGGMTLEARPVYRCPDGHEFERLERRTNSA
jgi:hypothetical protein